MPANRVGFVGFLVASSGASRTPPDGAMDPSEVQLQEIEDKEFKKEWPRLLTEAEVKKIIDMPGNQTCADCGHATSLLPTWASISFGVVLCSHAAGRHRSLGAHISRVFSLTLDKWDRENYERMLKTGNDLANSELECKLPEGFTKPCETGDNFAEFMVALDKFVRSKYQEKAFTRSGSGKLVESAQTKSMATIGSMQFSGVLLIKVKSARQLICLDVTSQSDPYVAAEMEGGQQKVRTKTVKDCANPVWDEVLMLNVRNFRSDVLRLAVWDADTLSEDDKIGHCEIPLRHLLRRASNDEHDEGHVRRMPDVATTRVFDDLILTGGDPHPCICVRLFQRNTPRGFLSVELTYQPLE